MSDDHVIRIVCEPGVPTSWDEMTEEQKDASARAVVRLAMTLDEIARANDAATTEETAA